MVVSVLLTAPVPALAQALSAELAMLEPLIGRHWVGTMRSPDGQRAWRTERDFQPLWNGRVVKYSSATPEIDGYSEGYFYWDKEAAAVAAFVLSSRGVVQKGVVSLKEGVLTVSGTIVFPERSFEYRNTFEITPEGKLVDRWFQNAFGPWRPGHVIELTATTP